MTINKLEKDKLILTVRQKIKKSEVLLDIGCGIVPQNYTHPLVHICCEPFPEYVKVLSDKIKDVNDPKYVLLNASWEDALRIFPDKSVDSVFLIDVIEHLEKDIALKLLERTGKICRKQIVIFTPLGFLPQEHSDDKDAWGLHGGQMQKHKSGWVPSDFDSNWDIYLSEVFHEYNNLGEKFEIPYGAFFAIKNLNEYESKDNDDIMTIYHLINKVNNHFTLKSFIVFLKGIFFIRTKSKNLFGLLSKNMKI